MLLISGVASATDFRLGEVEGLIDLSLSYGLQVRTQDREDETIGIARRG